VQVRQSNLKTTIVLFPVDKRQHYQPMEILPSPIRINKKLEVGESQASKPELNLVFPLY
jgi:hypothetical protein